MSYEWKPILGQPNAIYKPVDREIQDKMPTLLSVEEARARLYRDLPGLGIMVLGGLIVAATGTTILYYLLN